LEELFDEDACQTQEQYASALGVIRQAISHIGNYSKDLKPKDVERCLFTCKQLLQRKKKDHYNVTEDENGFITAS